MSIDIAHTLRQQGVYRYASVETFGSGTEVKFTSAKNFDLLVQQFVAKLPTCRLACTVTAMFYLTFFSHTTPSVILWRG
jgi:hypothetical protein